MTACDPKRSSEIYNAGGECYSLLPRIKIERAMELVAMTGGSEIRWIKLGVIGGLCASVLYPVVLLVPMRPATAAAVAAFLGPAIGVGSLGLCQLLVLHGQRVAATLGALANIVAGALLTAMLLVQFATDASGWNSMHRDPVDRRPWGLAYPASGMHGGGPPTLCILSAEDAARKVNEGQLHSA